MIHPSKVGQLVKFIPDRFDYNMLQDEYPDATASEIYKVVNVEDLNEIGDYWGNTTSYITISPIANSSVEIEGIYASRFKVVSSQISKTKPIKE